jgi:PKD domain
MMFHGKQFRRAVLPLMLIGCGLLATATPSSAATPPAAPSGLTVTYTTGSMNLSWVDTATDETGFSVERCLTADCSSAGQIATVGANVTTFTDTFYVSGAANAYRVKAVNVAGASAGSNIASLGLFSTGEVHPVVTATPISGPAPLTVAFDASASTALSGTITSWTWSFGDDQFGSGVTTSHTFTAPGTYATRVRVGATGGFGNPSNSAVVLVNVTAPAVPLAAPTNLTATSPSRGRVGLAWTNPVSSATALTVERCKGATCTNFTPIATVPLAATSYADTTGTRGTTYSYRLAASNGTSTVYSNRATVTVRR